MRQKARRHAHVRIRNGLDVDRRQPTDEEIQDLLEGISRNAVPKFGLVKLSAMRLDDGVEPPAWFERIIRWPKGELIPIIHLAALRRSCLLYTSPSPRDGLLSRMPSSA